MWERLEKEIDRDNQIEDLQRSLKNLTNENNFLR